jgi:flagellar hook-associated protein 2
LKSAGTATLTVTDDADAIVEKVRDLVTAFNDAVTFVADESEVTREENGSDVRLGSLTTSSTARRTVDRLHELFSGALAGATTKYVNLSSIGLATQADGTILFNEGEFRAALGDDPSAVAAIFAGNGTGTGVATDLAAYVGDATGAGGSISIGTTALDTEIRTLQDQIDDAQRAVDAFEQDLRLQFTALEALVGGLQSQSSFLSQAFG